LCSKTWAAFWGLAGGDWRSAKPINSEIGERRVVQAARFCLSNIRYQRRRDPLTALRQRMRELAQTRVRCALV
jgi:hypothetical protein